MVRKAWVVGVEFCLRVTVIHQIFWVYLSLSFSQVVIFCSAVVPGQPYPLFDWYEWMLVFLFRLRQVHLVESFHVPVTGRYGCLLLQSGICDWVRLSSLSCLTWIVLAKRPFIMRSLLDKLGFLIAVGHWFDVRLLYFPWKNVWLFAWALCCVALVACLVGWALMNALHWGIFINTTTKIQNKRVCFGRLRVRGFQQTYYLVSMDHDHVNSAMFSFIMMLKAPTGTC